MTRLELAMGDEGVGMRFGARFNAPVGRPPGLDRLLLSIMVQHFEEILPIEPVMVSAKPYHLFMEHDRRAQELRRLLAGIDRSQKLADLAPFTQARIEGTYAHLLELAGVGDRRWDASCRVLAVLRAISADLERAFHASTGATAREADASSPEGVAGESESPEDLLGDLGYESDGDGEVRGGGPDPTRHTPGMSIMESHIRACVDQDMAYELLRILTGTRGASAKLDILHNKIFVAWADRLESLSAEVLVSQRQEHIPGGELDRRFLAAIRNAASRAAVQAASSLFSEETMEYWGDKFQSE